MPGCENLSEPTTQLICSPFNYKKSIENENFINIFIVIRCLEKGQTILDKHF